MKIEWMCDLNLLANAVINNRNSSDVNTTSAMCKLFILLLAGFVLMACASPANNQQIVNYAQSDKDYLALKQTIINKLADASTFDRILSTYSLTSFYDPSSDREQSAMLLTESYQEQGNYAACLEVAMSLLDTNYTSLTGHFAASNCARLNGDERAAQYHTWVLDNLIEAIWRTGDGQSPESAFMINSSIDLYAFIQLHQLVAVGQDLVYLRNVPIQKISIQTPENNRMSTWYFNVTPQFRRGLIDNIESS